jgi:hypothetical protein
MSAEAQREATANGLSLQNYTAPPPCQAAPTRHQANNLPASGASQNDTSVKVILDAGRMPSSSGATLQMGTANGKALDGGATIATSKASSTRKAIGFDISPGSTITRSPRRPEAGDWNPPGLVFAQDLAHADIKGNRNDKQAETGWGIPIRIAS